VVRTVRAACVLAMAIAGCGGRDPHAVDAGDGDAPLTRDGMRADRPGVDVGPDVRVDVRMDGPVDGVDAGHPCFVPADCSDGQRCCLSVQDLVVSCQASAACPGDGVSTYVACATSADCPPAAPTCTFLAQGPNGSPFNICGASP